MRQRLITDNLSNRNFHNHLSHPAGTKAIFLNHIIMLNFNMTSKPVTHTKLHSKDNAAARRRLRRRIIHKLRKLTTMPTKIAKDRMRIPQGSAKRSYSFPTGSCHSEIGNYMRLGSITILLCVLSSGGAWHQVPSCADGH